MADFINVSSIVLSTALRAPGIRDLATAMAPFLSRSVAPGCDSSKLVMNTSNQSKYLCIGRKAVELTSIMIKYYNFCVANTSLIEIINILI